MKKHNILSKLKRISRKIACIIATAVMCLNNIGLNQIKQVSAQTSMGNAYKITENDSTKNKWQNTDKNGDQMTHRFSSYESDKSKALWIQITKNKCNESNRNQRNKVCSSKQIQW